jgi:hypothetical protein
MPKSEKTFRVLSAAVSALVLAGSAAGFFLMDFLPERAGILGGSTFYRQTLLLIFTK